MDDDERFIIQSNIKRFCELLHGPLDAPTRKTVEALLVAAELELGKGARAAC